MDTLPLHTSVEDKDQVRQKMFGSMVLRVTDVIIVDKWINLCMEHGILNATTLPANAILELFTESDLDKDGIHCKAN